jgi:ABC-2 type transport system ATP-binding protein
MSVLSLESLSKSFGAVRALRDLSFDVHGGEIFGFVGSNGAGKSTAMRIVLGVLASDAGEVRWDGRLIDHDVRRRIGYMPEERGLYPRMKVGDQLVYLARLHGLDAAAARSAMTKWTDLLGVGPRRGDDVLKLSLGNQQRVQLAAALVHEPDILVLDEPFSGLDPVAVDVMSGVLREQAARGVPVMFSSHQLDLVERLSDRVGIIKDGSMVAVGDIDRLREERADEERRWIVDGAPPDTWLASVPSARLVSTDGTRSLVELADHRADADGQALLTAALGAGPVREFARQRPSLAELYRDVVAPAEAAEVAA